MRGGCRSGKGYFALWATVLSEAVCTWVILHPDHCANLSHGMHFEWRCANSWLFGERTNTWELCELATGINRDYLRIAVRFLLREIDVAPRTITGRSSAMRELGIMSRDCLTNLRHRVVLSKEPLHKCA
jgi:hypothetical protein